VRAEGIVGRDGGAELLLGRERQLVDAVQRNRSVELRPVERRVLEQVGDLLVEVRRVDVAYCVTLQRTGVLSQVCVVAPAVSVAASVTDSVPLPRFFFRDPSIL
jgi:hypothetical protein